MWLYGQIVSRVPIRARYPRETRFKWPLASLASVAKVLRLTEGSFEEVVDAECRILSLGGVVALPTDKLYGITTTLDHADALFALKKRSCEKPLGLFVSSADDVTRWAKSTVSASVLSALLPGPVTLILERLPTLPAHFNPNTNLVGIRVPDCPVVQVITAKLNVPLAQTSANINGTASPTCVNDFEKLIPRIDLVVDGGSIGHGSEGSTVVDLSVPREYHIMRDGCARIQMEKVLNAFGLAPRIM